MSEKIIIPVTYEEKDYDFEADLQVWQYGYRFILSMGDLNLVFERDDSGDYRAIIPEGYAGKLPDKGLVQAIAEVLDAL